MKTTKLLLIALVLSAMAATSAMAQTVTRTSTTNTRPSISGQTAVTNHWGGNRHRHHRHYRHHRSRSNVFFGIGLGYPYYGYGYPYHGSYPYGYGYYPRPRAVVYAETAYTDDATVAAVQRRLARAGYYRGAIDGVIGHGTRSAIRAFERNNGLPIDGRIDRRLLATMGLA
jgi:Ni/Co efflux regulator RcnB